MTDYPIPLNDKQRLEELLSYQILDTPIESEFEDIISIVTNTFQVPAAAITFLDKHRQWIKAERGLGFCELDRDVSICNYVILQSEVFEINDLFADERFRTFPYVANEPHYRFYAGVPLITRNGYPIGSLCIVDYQVRYLTKEQHRLMIAFARNIVTQLELRLENVSLQQQNETQQRISAALSHDMRGPLGNIKVVLEMQEEEMSYADGTDHKESHRELINSVDNTMGILNSMVEWGRLQLSRESSGATFGLRQLVDLALNEVYHVNCAKQNTLVNAIPGTVMIEGEPEGIRFVLRNLLTNAGKFTRHGCITVSCSQEGCNTRLMVNDTGTGINPETVTRLNRRQPIQYTNGTNNEKGNGLGLSLVQEYLAKQNKQLYFQSQMGIGTVVSFEL